jgi:hypothetical protein
VQAGAREYLVQCAEVIAGIGAQLKHAADRFGARQGPAEERQVGGYQMLAYIATNILIAEFAAPELFLLAHGTHATLLLLSIKR